MNKEIHNELQDLRIDIETGLDREISSISKRILEIEFKMKDQL